MTTEKIIEKFNNLYKYSNALPKGNKDEFISDLNILFEYVKENVPQLTKRIEKLDKKDIRDLEYLEKKIISDTYSENEEVEAKLAHRIIQKIISDSPLMMKEQESKPLLVVSQPAPALVAVAATPPVTNSVTSNISNIEFSNDVKAPEIERKRDTGKLFIKTEDLVHERTLYSVTKILIPNITIKGQNVLDYKVGSERISSILKLIDEKTSIADLYNLYSYNYDNFLEFLNILYEAEKTKLVTFIKIENMDGKSARVKLGQLLLESNLVHQINITNAMNYKKNKSMFIGEALLELRYITDEILIDTLKVQTWLSELVESSVFIDGIVQIEGLATNSKSVANIFDFIIPSFTPEAKITITNSNNTNISSLIDILNGEASLLSAFENNRKHFKNDRFLFFKLIRTLDAQHFLVYTKNEKVKERNTNLRFGELAINLGLVNDEQIEETFIYRQNNPDKKLLIGETLVELNYLNAENLENCLTLQKWCNHIISKMSYENAFINAIKEVLEDYFKLSVNVGKFAKKAFTRPLLNMICITYTFSGELNGQVYYIFDRNFLENMTKTIMSSYNVESFEIDESIIGELCNMITGNSLSKLSKQNIFCEADMPEIIINKEIVIANQKPVSILPLTSEYGRFILGFDLNG